MSIEKEDIIQNIKQTQAEFKTLGRVTDNVNAQVRRISEGSLQNMIKALEDISIRGKSAQDVLQNFSEKMFKTILDQVSKQFGSDINTNKKQNKKDLAQTLFGGLFGGGLSNQAQTPVQVTVINNTQAQVQTQEQVGRNGQRQLQIMIDNMVADSLVRGSATQNVLSNVFGITQQLVSR
jgi:hypothetical protein